MKTTRLFLFSVLMAFLFVASCKKDEDKKVNEAEVLVNYLESASSPLGKDYVNSDMPSIIAASEVKTLNETGQIYIIDIRSADDFALGHIENAHNVAFADILTHIDGVDLTPYTKVAVVCYTGQTAGYAASLLRIMGYDKVYSMKWGMCSWNADFATKWQSNTKNDYRAMFTTQATAKGAAGDLPTLSTGKTEGIDILKARVNAVLNEGFTTVTAKGVFDNLTSYYIVNYWPENHYSSTGHVPGAVQYTPKASIKLSADLKTIPANMPVAVYCYTGQTSAYLTAYLRVLGYDAQSILFGTNCMIYDDMVEASMPTFSDSQIMGYEYVN